jgi:hypothetical protein
MATKRNSDHTSTARPGSKEARQNEEQSNSSSVEIRGVQIVGNTPTTSLAPVTSLLTPGLSVNPGTFAPGNVGLETEIWISIFRREDMVALSFVFQHFAFDEGRANLICQRRSSTGTPQTPRIFVSHGPQHVLEKCYPEPPDPPAPDVSTPLRGPVPTLLSNYSRVAYLVPDSVTSIPFTVEDLLAVARDYPLAVGLNATPPDPPPTGTVTVRPGGLVLTPLLDNGYLAAHPDWRPSGLADTFIATRTVAKTAGRHAGNRAGHGPFGWQHRAASALAGAAHGGPARGGFRDLD